MPLTTVKPLTPNSYWSEKGNFQAAYDAMANALVPMMNEADTVPGELVRLVANVYYERFNNGGSFGGGQHAEDGRKLVRMMREHGGFVTPTMADDSTWDVMTDAVVLAAWRLVAMDPTVLARVMAFKKKA